MEPLTKFFLYARKSTDEANRQVLSIESQLCELRELAKREGVTIVREFVESQTAKKPGRPIFNEMLAEIEKGKAGGIIAWHPDRLARNSMDGGRVIYLTDTGKIADLKFPTFRFESTAHGKFMLSIAFCQSKYYVDNLSENVRRGHRQKLRNGVWPNCAPLGYKNDRTNRCLALDEERAPLIRKAFELYATGDFALAEVQRRINALGLTGRENLPLRLGKYHRIFSNPIYYGMIRFNGEMFEGKHDPIISKRLFDEVQKRLAQKSKSRTPKLKPYLYRGLLRCGECGCFITIETQKGHNYLHCTKRKGPCKQGRYVREHEVTDQVVATVAKVELREDWADKMLAALEEEKAAFEAAQKAGKERIKAKILQCDAKLDALLDMVLSNSLSRGEYASKKQTLLNEKASLKEKLTASEGKGGKRFEPVKEFLEAGKQAVFLARERNPASCRDFLKKHGSNFLLTDQRVSLEWQKPFILLEKSNSSPRHARKISGNISPVVDWRKGWDLNPR